MSSSEHGSFVRFDATDLATDQPVDTGLVRDSLVNTVQHAYDEHFQARASWLTHDATKYLAPDDESSVLPRFVTMIGPFPYTVRADGSGALLIVQLYGEAASSGEEVTWYVQLRGFGDPIAAPSGVPGSEASFVTGDAYVWTDPATLQLESRDIPRTHYTYSTPLSLGGDRVSADVTAARLDVWVVSDAGEGSDPRLAGWLAREFVGT